MGGHSARGQDKVKGPSLGPSNHRPSTILRTGSGVGGSRWLCSPEGVKTQVPRLSVLGGRRLGGQLGCIPGQMLQLLPSYSQTSSSAQDGGSPRPPHIPNIGDLRQTEAWGPGLTHRHTAPNKKLKRLN